MDSVNYTPPTRRSMSDEELAIVLNQPHADEASMLAAMQLLEQQSALRAEDVRLEAMWAVEMQVINSAQSIAALNAFRSGVNAAAATPNPAHVTASTPPAEAAQAAPVAPVEVAQAAPVAPAAPVASAEAPVSLFDQIAQANAATAQPVAVPATDSALATAPAHEVAVEQFPLVPVAAAPDISVAAAAINEPAAFEPAPFIEPTPAVESVALGSVAAPVSAVSVEQQVTEFEEAREAGVDRSAIATAAAYAAEDSSLGGAFDDIIEVAPQPASDYLDEAKGVVSTAHGPNTNQRASAMFFNWLPIGGSVLPVILAVYVHSLGMPLTDSVTAILIAIFAAFATTTAGAIAGKRAGLPTFVVSRATFGVYGARIPAAIFALLKLVTAAVLVLLLVVASQGAVEGWSVEGATATRWQVGPVSVALWQIIIGCAVVLVAVTSFIRLKYIKFLNLFVGIIASLAVIGSLSYQLYRVGFDLQFYYLESWPKTIGAAIIAFAALGTVWSSSGADFASALEPNVKGSRVIGWSSLSLLIVPGGIATATLILLQSTEAKTQLLGLASIVPNIAQPYAYGVFAAVALLLAAIELRSTRLALRGVFTRWSGAKTQSVLALLFVGIALAGWHFYSTQGLLYNLHDYALVISVPVAGWLGIFAADTLVRRIAYHEISLTRSYGFYGNYNLTNLFGWLLATAAGLGMISSTLQEFSWVGFAAKHAVNPEFWAVSNLGVAAAFAIGVLFPLCFGIPRIKRQEAEVLSIESRRYELRDVLVTSEIEQLQPANYRGE